LNRYEIKDFSTGSSKQPYILGITQKKDLSRLQRSMDEGEMAAVLHEYVHGPISSHQ